jgi:hypothetical protein
MNITKHANTRAQQRGITSNFLDLIYAFGDIQNAGNGCIVRYFGRKSLELVRLHLGSRYVRENHEKFRIFTIETRVDPTIITTGKLYKKVRVSNFSKLKKVKNKYRRRPKKLKPLSLGALS